MALVYSEPTNILKYSAQQDDVECLNDGRKKSSNSEQKPNAIPKCIIIRLLGKFALHIAYSSLHIEQ